MPADVLTEAYRKSHPKSGEFHQQAKAYFAGDGATAFIRSLDPYRPYITRASGSRKWDVDGNEYIDYTMGHGALLLGHSHPAIVGAIQAQAAKGLHYGDNHELEILWARAIADLVPSAERIEFFACGQEANLMAIRLSRVFSGRRKILRFVENFHGWADPVVLPPTSPGTVADDVTLIPCDLDRAEAALATRQYAVLMTEGGGAHMSGQVPVDFEFVRALPGLTRKYGTVWHLDEVVTGFRDHVAGFQGMVGVAPDLTSYGKVVAGGLGAGVLAGRADILHAFSRGVSEDKRVRHSGTWNANPLASAAGVAAMKLYADGAPQRRANELAAYLRREGNRALSARGFGARLYGRSITHLYLGPVEVETTDETLPPTRDLEKIVGGLPVKERLCLHLLQRGISTMAARLFVLSAAHSEADIDLTVAALVESLTAMREEGSLPA